MKLFFDTSAVVAALVTRHPHHAGAWSWFSSVQAGKNEGHLCAHSLAEVYASLSAMPVRPMPSPAEVSQLVQESILPNFTIAELTRADYERAIALCAKRLLRSGAIFDALIEVAARKAKARHLVTINSADFRRFNDDHETWLVDPRERSPR